MFQCRYAGAPRGPKYEMWREEFDQRWLAADFDPVDTDYIANEFRGSEHSFLGLCSMHGSPVHTTRRHETRDWIYVILPSGAQVQTQQRGQSNELSLGQMTLISATEPCRVTLTTTGNRWSIRVPRRFLNEVCRNLDGKIARPVTAADELTRLLLQQVETTHRFGPRLDAAANHAMAQHILDLVVLCVGADPDATRAAEQRGLAAARLDAIRDDILRNLGTSDLALDRIATRHRVSARYIQYLFERAGTSFTGFVIEQRLQRAHRLLCDPAHKWRKVSDIAATVGFSDISYFNRAFKARFAATPREVRHVPTRADRTT